MANCVFVSDLHGRQGRYQALFRKIEEDRPRMVFLGGDLMPHYMIRNESYPDFLHDYLFPNLERLRSVLRHSYPRIFLILGNDDARSEEEALVQASESGLFYYMNQRMVSLGDHLVFGYSFVPPTPFLMKDWEKYDVSRYVDPGCVPPTEGIRTTDHTEDIEYATIQKDLEELSGNADVSKAVFLFHSPPYDTFLDRAALDGKMVDHVPLDVHVGSIAIKRFIEERQPLLTLHGHIHESTRLTGHWMQQIGRTVAINAAHDGPELSVVEFTLEDPTAARRILL